MIAVRSGQFANLMSLRTKCQIVRKLTVSGWCGFPRLFVSVCLSVCFVAQPSARHLDGIYLDQRLQAFRCDCRHHDVHPPGQNRMPGKSTDCGPVLHAHTYLKGCLPCTRCQFKTPRHFFVSPIFRHIASHCKHCWNLCHERFYLRWKPTSSPHPSPRVRSVASNALLSSCVTAGISLPDLKFNPASACLANASCSKTIQEKYDGHGCLPAHRCTSSATKPNAPLDCIDNLWVWSRTWQPWEMCHTTIQPSSHASEIKSGRWFNA